MRLAFDRKLSAKKPDTSTPILQIRAQADIRKRHALSLSARSSRWSIRAPARLWARLRLRAYASPLRLFRMAKYAYASTVNSGILSLEKNTKKARSP